MSATLGQALLSASAPAVGLHEAMFITLAADR